MRLSIFVLLCVVSTSAVATEPFDFRGARLGMSLSAFKKLPFPNGNRQATDDVPSLFCTGDQKKEIGLSRISVSGADKTLGVIKCAWFTPPNKALYQLFWRDAFIVVGQYTSQDVTFSFIKTPEASEHQLYSISILMTNQGFSSVAAGLTERFGKPASTQMGEVKNKIGNSFSNTTITWLNDVSSIRLEERFTTIDEMWLHYSHTALTQYYLAERKKITGTPGSKL